MVATSTVQKNPYDDRVDSSLERNVTSVILLWSFHDPIRPQVILEAPEDLFCFAFSENPCLLVGGLNSGQVALWDLSGIMERLYNKYHHFVKAE